MVMGCRFFLGAARRKQEKRFNAESTEVAEDAEKKGEKAPG
jgi:hypothetical protein